jgi:hypothetical protein
VHRPASLSALRSVSSVKESLPLVLNSAPGVGPSGPSVFGPVPERDDLCCLSLIPAARQPKRASPCCPAPPAVDLARFG